MRESLSRQCEMFIHNRDEIKSYFRWESAELVAVCASEICSNNIQVETETLLECKNILDKGTGVFSNFRGASKLPVISMLATDDEPSKKLETILEIHNLLKLKFSDSQYLTLLAAKLFNMISEDDVEECANRGKEIYNLMKKEHPFLTSREDNVFAVLLSFSDKENDALVADMEECYRTMKKFSPDSNAMQSLSHVLALANGTPEEKCSRVIEMFNALDEQGKKYSKSYEMAVLGVLSILPLDMAQVIDDVVEVDDFLSTQKGYGGIGIAKKTRLMHAAMLVANDYAENSVVNTAAISGTMAMIAAGQAAMCAIIASTVAVSSTH